MTPALLAPSRPRVAPPEDATRREFITGVGAAALAAAFLAACGGEDEAPSPTPDSMIDFTYEDITTRVPRNPKRVVVMEGRGDLDFALSVGYPVIAAGTWTPDEVGPPFVGRLDDAELLPAMYPEADYETLVRLQPDLIVQRANAFRGDFYGNERLAEIAPVLSVECNRADWRTDLEAQARLLDRDQAVAEQLATYDAAVAAAKEEVGGILAGHTVALITISPESALVWTSDFATEVAHDLGMELPFRNSGQEETNSYLELSAEHWDQLDGIDLIFAQGLEDSRDGLGSIGTWTRLPAVAAGRVVNFPGELNNGMALTATTLVDVLAEGARLLA
ncbi:MAG: ABC transporter substrate-binding protein [Dehalococcoidia bacterium]|nr:ABC transporter substrate-binding protein [Dehalococcoidia bacterium]